MGTIQETPATPTEEAAPLPPPSDNNSEIVPETINVDPLSETSIVSDNASGEVTSGSGDDKKMNDTLDTVPKNDSVRVAVLKEPKTSDNNQKTSGIPALSRIARPCIGHQKPAIPAATPTKNFTDSSARNYGDDYGKHKLTDVQEENEDDTLAVSLDVSTKHHSSVLTEDTDSFIIGDRVWVGGTKPGQIAYIGETQFAPGDWAGIVLDQPIGKNDGSVGGIRYFQCEPKRGVFSRLTRLTRLPLEGADTSSVYSLTSTPISNGVRRRVGSPLSPTGSSKSLRKSPVSLTASNTSISSITHAIDFKIGDRVIVKSSQGSKVGIVRYMGPTSFAAGEWCGVELDEPRGKNDGSVDGKRYFECTPQYGLFAPVSKVSKSPLKYKPGNCVVHSGTGLPPSGLRKAGSRESMTSTTTSLASATSGARRVRLGINSLTPQKIALKTPTGAFPTRTALQDVLREKQQHIEQLLKERDLERSEVTRAANQADEAEQKFTLLKSEYERYRLECEAKFHEYSSVFSQLNVDRGHLLVQLDDEKRKNEDLQFKFEETAITKCDIEDSNEHNLHRIKDLEEQLASERQKIDLLEADSGKLFEAEEALVKSREDVDNLKAELQNANTKRQALEEETSKTTKSLAALKEDFQKLELARTESDKNVEQLKLAALSDNDLRNKFEGEISEYRTKLKESDDNHKKREGEIDALKTEMVATKAQLAETSLALEKQIKEKNEFENQLKSELDKHKQEIGLKNADIESRSDTVKSKEEEIQSLKSRLEAVENNLKNKSSDADRYKTNMQELEANMKKEIEELKEKLKREVSEKEEHEKMGAVALSKRDLELQDANKTIAQHLEEIQRLKKDLEEEKQNAERASSEARDRHTKQIQLKETELATVVFDIQQKNDQISKYTVDIAKLNDDIATKNGEIEKLRVEIESCQKRSNNEQLLISKCNEQINNLQLASGDLQRKYAASEERIVQLTQQKQHLESEIQSLMNSSGDYSAKLQELTGIVAQKDQILETIQAEHTGKLQEYQRIEQQLQLELQKVVQDAERTKSEYEEKLRVSNENQELLKQQCQTSATDTAKIRDELSTKLSELQRVVEQKETELKKFSESSVETERHAKEQFEKTTADLQKTVESCQAKLNALTLENVEYKNAIAQKSELIIEIEAKLKHNLAQSQQRENEIRSECNEEIQKTESRLTEENAKMQQLSTEMNLLKQDCDNKNASVTEKDRRIKELSDELHNSHNSITQLQNEKSKLQSAEVEISKECATNKQQYTDLLNQVSVLTTKIETADKLAESLQSQKNTYVQLLQQLQITESQKRNLVAQLQDVAKKDLLEVAKNLEVTTNDENAREKAKLQGVIENTQQQLQMSNIQIESQKSEIARLQDELSKAQKLSESHSARLQNAPQVNNNPGCDDRQQLLEEKQMAEGQIEFLNSIIVDMQRKNEEQRIRIEMLESGYSAAAADELHLYGLPTKIIPPRAYCDICEEFDQHETEDCPLQSNEDPLPSNTRSGNKEQKVKSLERPYCEICEIFGHCTEDCTEDQTF